MKISHVISKILFTIILLYSSCGYFFSQNYQVIYEVTFKPEKGKNSFLKEYMVLKIGKDQSIFYNQNKAIIDSLVNQNNFKATRSVTNPLLRFNVSKTLSNDECFIGGNFNQFNYWYKENRPQFTQLKKTEPYKKYLTHQAFTDFGKRNWQILYTPEIPISDGPYVFFGLPGLVIKAESLDGDYVFEMIEIKKLNETESVEKKKDNISKAKLADMIKGFLKDPAAQRINFRNDIGDGFTYESKGVKDKNYKDTNESIKKITDQFNNYPDQDIPIVTF